MSPTQHPSGSLLTHFETLEDPRTAYLVEHPLLDIVALTICAVICGAETWEGIEAYGHSKSDWLKTFGRLAQRHPLSRYDCEGVCVVRADSVAGVLRQLGKSIAELSLGEVVSLDGKSARHSYDKRKGKGAIHMVSAWASENQLVLAQVKLSDKSNEITAIPKLLNILDVSGCIVTIDAMGAQRRLPSRLLTKALTTFSFQRQSGQPSRKCEQLFDWACKTNFKDIEHEAHQTIERAMVELNQALLAVANVGHLKDAHLWAGPTGWG